MKTSKLTSVLSRKFDVQINELSITQLFEKYESTGFIYPNKKSLLDPYFSNIRNNWEQMLQPQGDLLWILSTPAAQQHFASIAFWKQSNYGLFAQHLVSTGKPTLSLKIMLAAQYATEVFSEQNEIQSSQNWFRPNNRYAHRIFASMYEELGDKKAFLKEHQYLHFPLHAIKPLHRSQLVVEEVTGVNQAFIDFIREEYGQVFVTCEELDQVDVALSNIGKQYAAHGLIRKREIYVVKRKGSDEILASIIANKAPLGLNFSFLENRAYYILKSNLADNIRKDLLHSLNALAKSFYVDFELQTIPIVTDQTSSTLLQTQGAIFQRAYLQSIWLRSGFLQWYDHIYSFLRKLETRELAQKMLKQTLAQRQKNTVIAAV